MSTITQSSDLTTFLDESYAVSQQQIQDYRRDGYTVVEDLITGQALEQLRDAVAEAVESESVDDHLKIQGLGATYDRVFNQKVNLWNRHESIRPFALSRRFAGIAAQLEGRSMRIWHDQSLFKEPGKISVNKTPWHQDAPYWPHTDRAHSTTIWIALKDANARNGCMTFIPRTHTEEYQPVRFGTSDDLFEFAPKFKGSKGYMKELKAGSATFHNGLTFHYAGPNTTDQTREAYAVIYMPDDVRFNGETHMVTDPLKLTKDDLLAGDLFPIVARV